MHRDMFLSELHDTSLWCNGSLSKRFKEVLVSLNSQRPQLTASDNWQGYIVP